MDLYELLEQYRLHRPQLKNSTAETYRYAVRSFERFLGRKPDTVDLSEQLILRFLGRRLEQAADWTCKREVGSLRLLWAFAWKKKLTPHDPRDVDIPTVKLRQDPPIALTVQQVESILDSCRFERGKLLRTDIPKAAFWRLLVLTLYWTGARVGAVIACRQADLDRSTGWLRLRSETAKTGFGQCVRLPLDLAVSLPATDLLFPWPYGRRQLFVALKRIVVRAGLPPSREYRFHCLRRTAATLATSAASLDIASRALGRTTQQMTLRYVDPRVCCQPLSAVLPRVVG